MSVWYKYVIVFYVFSTSCRSNDWSKFLSYFYLLVLKKSYFDNDNNSRPFAVVGICGLFHSSFYIREGNCAASKVFNMTPKYLIRLQMIWDEGFKFKSSNVKCRSGGNLMSWFNAYYCPCEIEITTMTH